MVSAGVPVRDPVDPSVVAEELVVLVERLEVVEVVSWLERDVVELEVTEVVGAVGKSSDSDVSKSTVVVPVELVTGSVGTASTAGIGSSGATSSDGASSSSSSCVSSSLVCWMTVLTVLSNKAKDAGRGPAQMPMKRKVLLRRNRGRSPVTMLVEVMSPRRETSLRSLSAGMG